MPKLIKDQQVVDNTWTRIDAPTDLEVLPATPIFIPLAFWLENKAQLIQRVDTIGVTVSSTDDVSSLAEDCQSLPVIDVSFPAFMDGRGFSLGRLLRERHGFSGELRASGQIIRDQLCYLPGQGGFGASGP